MSEEIGYIYLAANPNMPGLIKIGMTKNVEERMNQLSAATGVPGDFECLFFMLVKTPADVERRLHSFYAYCRVSKRQEFFKVEWESVKATLTAMDVKIPEKPKPKPKPNPVTPPVGNGGKINGQALHPFLEAVKRNDLQEVKHMIEEGEDLNLKKWFGRPYAYTHGKLLIGGVLALNPNALMSDECDVIEMLIVELIKQNSGQFNTTDIALELGIETAALNKKSKTWFCFKKLKQLEKKGVLTSEKRGKNRYWLIPDENN